MNSVLSKEAFYETNYNIPYKQQKDAADAIRRTGANVKELNIVVWLIDGVYVSPSTMLKGLEEGKYVKKEKDNGTDEGGEVRTPRLHPHKGRPAEPVRDSEKLQRIHSNTDKRDSKQTRSRGDGRGSSKAVRGGNSKSTPVVGAEAKVRKSRTSISSRESDNDARQTRVEPKRQSRPDTAKPSRTGKRNAVRQEALRRSDTSRLRSKTGLRKRRS